MSSLAPIALAQEPAIAPEAAARSVEPATDTPPASGERRAEAELDSYLDDRVAEDRAALGQVPSGAERLQAALEEAFDPSLEEIELERLEDPALAVPRFVFDQLQRQSAVPTDAGSRDPSLPPPISQEDEIVANRVAAFNPRYAPSLTTAVELELELDAEGRVFRSRVIRSSGRPVLDEHARRTIRSLSDRSFGASVARHTVVVRLELVENVTRWLAGSGVFDLGGAAQLGILGRGISWSRARVVRLRPPSP